MVAATIENWAKAKLSKVIPLTEYYKDKSISLHRFYWALTLFQQPMFKKKIKILNYFCVFI